MSDASKGWLGVVFALLCAIALSASDLVEKSDPTGESLADEIAAYESGEYETAEYETADYATEDYASAEYETAARALPPVSLGVDPNDATVERGVPSLPEPFAAVDALATRSTAPAVLAVTRLDVNRKGHFVPNAAAAEVFDSYYAAYPNASDDVVRGRIVLALLDGLTPRAADEAIGVLDRWQAARDAANQLGADASAAERAAARDAELGADLARALSR